MFIFKNLKKKVIESIEKKQISENGCGDSYLGGYCGSSYSRPRAKKSTTNWSQTQAAAKQQSSHEKAKVQNFDVKQLCATVYTNANLLGTLIGVFKTSIVEQGIDLGINVNTALAELESACTKTVKAIDAEVQNSKENKSSATKSTTTQRPKPTYKRSSSYGGYSGCGGGVVYSGC